MKLILILLHVGFLFFAGCDQGKVLGPASKLELATAAEESCGYVQNEFGERVSWKSNLPVNMYIDSSVPDDMAESIKSAANKWSKAAGKNLFNFQMAAKANSITPSIDKVNSIYWSKVWDANKSSQQAITTLSFNGPLITGHHSSN